MAACVPVHTHSSWKFQSTPSAWRETLSALAARLTSFHFNPLPPHGGRRNAPSLTTQPGDFNPLPPHGGRLYGCTGMYKLTLFQSTPSAWRETWVWNNYNGVYSISIHSLRMEGDVSDYYADHQPSHFNPLPPHGGRHITGRLCADPELFQSTPSAWRETAKLHRKAFFISPILVQSCKKGCKRLHSAPEKMVFFEKREKNLVRNLQHLSVRL